MSMRHRLPTIRKLSRTIPHTPNHAIVSVTHHAATHEPSAIPISAYSSKREFGHEGVLLTRDARPGLSRILHRKIRRGGKSRQDHVAGGIDRQSVGTVTSVPADEGGVAQPATARADLHEYGVAIPLLNGDQGVVGVRKLHRSRNRNREWNVFHSRRNSFSRRSSFPADVCCTSRIHAYAGAE